MPVPSPATRCAPALLACVLGPLAHAQAPPPDTPDTIVVTGQRPDKPGTVTTLDSAALARQNAVDMQNMARYAPLVSVPAAASGGGSVWDSGGNTGFNIRGIEGNHVSLDLDGIALPDAAPKPDGATLSSFGIGRDYVDPETLRQVGILSGTTPTGPGTPGLGGSVSFVTKAPEDYLGAGRDRYADYKFGFDGAASMRLHALTGAAQSPSGRVKALALLVRRDGAAQESAGSAAVNPDDWHSDAVLAKLAWTPYAGQRLGLTLDAYRARHRRSYDNKVSSLYPAGVANDSGTRRNRVSLDYAQSTATPWFDGVDGRVYLQDAEIEDLTDARYVSGGQPYQRHIVTGFANRSAGAAGSAFKRFGAHGLGYGASVERVASRRPWNEDRTVLATGAHQYTSKERMADTDTRSAAVFARADLALASWLTATPGVRYTRRALAPKGNGDYVVALPAAARELRKRDDGYFTPSLALDASLRPGLNAWLQYSRGTRLPSAADLTGTYDSFSYTGAGSGYAVLGNADLRKETSNAFELGLKGTPARGLRLQAALFRTRYHDFIEYVAQPRDPVNYPTLTQGLFRPQNIGEARTWGGEASAELDLGQYAPALRGARLNLAGGIQHGKARNAVTGLEAELASTLPRKSSALLEWDDPGKRGGAGFAVVHVGAKQAAPDVIAGVSTARFAVPAATLMDFTAYWNPLRRVALSAGIYNLADRKVWDYASVRALAAPTTAATLADVERQARPGRTAALSARFIY